MSLTAGSIRHSLPQTWWLVLLRGLAAIVFGVLAFVWLGVTFWVFVAFYAAYAILDAILALGRKPDVICGSRGSLSQGQSCDSSGRNPTSFATARRANPASGS